MDYRKLTAELLGTFWLVLGGCGAAVLAGDHIGYAGVSLAFGLTVLTGAYAFGHISGGHFNPAVTLGLWAGGRFASKDIAGYVVAQVVGGILAAGLLCIISGSLTGHTGGLASNGYGALSPAGYGMSAAFITEVVMTAMFLVVIMGSTHGRAPAGFAPIAIGLGLTLIHLISIPVTNTSVNPARSTGPALVEMINGHGPGAMNQLWLFWLAPILGGVIGGYVYKWLEGSK
jgi:aquaporin Z